MISFLGEDRVGVPVLRLSGDEVTAFEKKNIESILGKSPGDDSAAQSAPDDNGVEGTHEIAAPAIESAKYAANCTLRVAPRGAKNII